MQTPIKAHPKTSSLLGIATCNDNLAVAKIENIAKTLFKRLNLPDNCTYLPKYHFEDKNRIFALKKGKFKIVFQISKIFSNKIYFTNEKLPMG